MTRPTILSRLTPLLLALLLAACQGLPQQVPDPTPALTLSELGECSVGSDCVFVFEGVCGGGAAVHKDNLETWENHLREQRRLERDIVCGPSIPPERYETTCANSRCRAVLVDEKALLTFSEAPALGKPVQLRLVFSFPEAAGQATASISIPESFDLVNGKLEWEGSLEAGQEGILEAGVEATRPGYYTLEGSAASGGGEYPLQLSDTVYVEINEGGATFGSRPENRWQTNQALPMAENNQQIESQLFVEPAPELGEQFKLTYHSTTSIALPDPQAIQIDLVFPSGAFEVLEAHFPEWGQASTYPGQLSWRGSLEPGQSVQLQAILRVLEPGWGVAYGSLTVQPGGEIPSLIQDVKAVELYVDKYSGRYTHLVP